jgi:DNA-binding transcriptional MerR regulator
MPQLLKVGDLARATGKTVRAIHIYEQMGLIRSVGRTTGRYRLFDSRTLDRLNWIAQLHAFGLSLTQIQELLGEMERHQVGREAMAQMRALYGEKLERIRGMIEALTGLKTELEQSLLYLETCKECEPAKPKEACVDCKRERPVAKPSLVRGLHADVGWIDHAARPRPERFPSDDPEGSSPNDGSSWTA